MKKFVVLEKKVGQTPLQCVESYKLSQPDLQDVPLAYAGRLDPMASGKLLILIGEECKKQEKYHKLDKEYEFTVLFGVHSDTGDVLGLVSSCNKSKIQEQAISKCVTKLRGDIELPYPHYSSKTVRGKPLHTWALENRIDKIDIPTKKSKIHSLKLTKLREISFGEVCKYVTEKIETIPKVTDERKVLGNDFRRDDIRHSWKILQSNIPDTEMYALATFKCICSSGTYMRTLASTIAVDIGTCGLAYNIHRTKIGTYQKIPFNLGFWSTLF